MLLQLSPTNSSIYSDRPVKLFSLTLGARRPATLPGTRGERDNEEHLWAVMSQFCGEKPDGEKLEQNIDAIVQRSKKWDTDIDTWNDSPVSRGSRKNNKNITLAS